MHWVETLTDGGKLRQMHRFARNGGGNNERNPCHMWMPSCLGWVSCCPQFSRSFSFLSSRFLCLNPHPTSPVCSTPHSDIYFIFYMCRWQAFVSLSSILFLERNISETWAKFFSFNVNFDPRVNCVEWIRRSKVTVSMRQIFNIFCAAGLIVCIKNPFVTSPLHLPYLSTVVHCKLFYFVEDQVIVIAPCDPSLYQGLYVSVERHGYNWYEEV